MFRPGRSRLRASRWAMTAAKNGGPRQTRRLDHPEPVPSTAQDRAGYRRPVGTASELAKAYGAPDKNAARKSNADTFVVGSDRRRSDLPQLARRQVSQIFTRCRRRVTSGCRHFHLTAAPVIAAIPAGVAVFLQRFRATPRPVLDPACRAACRTPPPTRRRFRPSTSERTGRSAPRSRLGHQHGVLELRREPAVGRHHRPAVVEHAHARAARG